jgi:hypothetical protein
MKKEFIPYEQALALRELGFDEKCFTWYWDDGNLYEGLTLGNHRDQNGCLSAPLYQQAFRWFRNAHSLCSHVRMYDGEFTFEINEVEFVLQNKKTHEEAELACLIKLIEIIKQ